MSKPKLDVFMEKDSPSRLLVSKKAADAARDFAVEGLNRRKTGSVDGDPSGYTRMPVTSIHLLDDAFEKSGKREDMNLPGWWDAAVTESEIAADREAKETVFWRAGPVMVCTGPFTYSLVRRLHGGLRHQGAFADPDFDSQVLINPDIESQAGRSIIKDFGVTVSPDVRAILDGRENAAQVLQAHVKAAKNAGYKIPSRELFPTRPTPEGDPDHSLRKHQEDAVLAMAHLRSVLLADQVGLGKTAEFINAALCVAQKNIEDGQPYKDQFPVVIVVPASIVDNTVDEVGMWKDDAKIERLSGQKRRKISEDAEFIVLGIPILHHRVDDIIEANPTALIIDECHAVKGRTSLQTAAARKLSRSIRKRHDKPLIIGASGTPYPNTPSELSSVLDVIGALDQFASYAYSRIDNPQGSVSLKINGEMKKFYLSDRPDLVFDIRWAGGHKHSRYNQWVNNGTTNAAELNRLLQRNCMVRRRKSDVISPLPPLNENVLKIDLGAEERAHYDKVQKEFRDFVLERAEREARENNIPINEAKEIALMKLDSAEMLMKMTSLRQAVAEAKIPGVISWIHRFMAGDEEITGGDPERKKIIIFAHHKSMQNALLNNEELQQYGVRHILSGQKDIQDHVHAFQEKNDDYRIIVCQSGAREGHTLTAARDVLLTEIPFVPSWVVQMAGRAWARMSRDYEPHEATIHYAVAENTIDSKQMARLKVKKASFDAVIDGEGFNDQGELENETDLQSVDADLLLSLLVSGEVGVDVAR